MEQLVNFVIRPPRADYSAKHDLLDKQFRLKGRWFQRKDLEIKNRKGLTLQCSHYVPLSVPEGTILPCVIYCHGNSGCRADASEAAIILLPSNITVFTLDFSGSGLSEGEHVTLGWNEKEDLRAVVDFLRAEGSVSCIGLWGRSMGAVTSLMYGAEDPSIAGVVLDSPFSNLMDLMMELVDTYKYPLPKFTVKFAIQHMRRVIKKKAGFDIMDLEAVQVAKCSFIPALFGHAEDDDFIPPHHSDRICSAYAGDKNIIKFDGDHNSPRPQFYFDSITIFFHNVLNPPDIAYDELYFSTKNDYIDEADWEASFARLNGESMAVPPLIPGSGNTEDAINRVRRRRPMSRIEVPCSGEDLQESKENSSDLNSSSSPSLSSLVASHDVQSSVPTVPDDPRYLEYLIGNSSDIPCNIDDEERMIMKAIIESLKDLEVQNTTSSDSQKDVEASSSEHHCTSSLSNEGTGVATASLSNGAAPCTVSERNADGTPCDELSNTANVSTSQGDEAVAGTQARLVVQKPSSSHILDGLVQRWSSLFKGSG